MDTKSIDLGKLVIMIREYNQQFGWGSIMAKTLLNCFQKEKIEELDFEIQRQISWGKIEKEFGVILEEIGLSLEPIRGAFTIFGVNSEIPSSEMRLNIENPNMFISYISSLIPSEITSSQIYGLEEVANNLTLQFSGNYHLEDLADERILNFFSCLSPMVARYQELGLGKSVEILDKYLNISKKGYIREYLLTEKTSLLSEVGGKNFGPSKWRTDMRPEMYKERWIQTVDILKSISKNPRAGELVEQIRCNLKKSVEYAMKDLRENKPMYLSCYKDRYEIFQEVLQDCLSRL
jgi:hypothetical protein